MLYQVYDVWCDTKCTSCHLSHLLILLVFFPGKPDTTPVVVTARTLKRCAMQDRQKKGKSSLSFPDPGLDRAKAWAWSELLYVRTHVPGSIVYSYIYIYSCEWVRIVLSHFPQLTVEQLSSYFWDFSFRRNHHVRTLLHAGGAPCSMRSPDGTGIVYTPYTVRQPGHHRLPSGRRARSTCKCCCCFHAQQCLLWYHLLILKLQQVRSVCLNYFRDEEDDLERSRFRSRRPPFFPQWLFKELKKSPHDCIRTYCCRSNWQSYRTDRWSTKPACGWRDPGTALFSTSAIPTRPRRSPSRNLWDRLFFTI